MVEDGIGTHTFYPWTAKDCDGSRAGIRKPLLSCVKEDGGRIKKEIREIIIYCS
jgi:hypothetical protein